MTRSHDAVTHAQFGPRAADYVQSAVHASGADLDMLEAAARSSGAQHALDLGCGGGHAAYRMAAHIGQVTACDLSPEMLAAVAEAARERGIGNIATEQAAAEALPFADGAFDFLACRYSAHHWRDLDAGLRQARRVLRPNAAAVFIDAVSPGAPLLDTHLQAVASEEVRSHFAIEGDGSFLLDVMVLQAA